MPRGGYRAQLEGGRASELSKPAKQELARRERKTAALERWHERQGQRAPEPSSQLELLARRCGVSAAEIQRQTLEALRQRAALERASSRAGGGIGRSSVVFLGNTTESHSVVAAQQLRAYQLKRKLRGKRRETLWAVSSVPRMQACGRRRIDRQSDTIDVTMREGRASMAGVALCGSMNCPYCGPPLRQARAVELDRGMRQFLEDHPDGAIGFGTFTFSHDRGDSAELQVEAITKAWQKVKNGRRWMDDRERFAIAGTTRALDQTHGQANGWHYHLHVAFWFERRPTPRQLEQLQRRLYARWAREVERLELGPVIYRRTMKDGSVFRGVQLELARNAEDVAAYICKLVQDETTTTPEGATSTRAKPIAYELTRHDTKTGYGQGHGAHRTPVEILDAITAARAAAKSRSGWTPDVKRAARRDVRLWREHEQATRGRALLVWSRGLKARVGIQTGNDRDTVAKLEQAPGAMVMRIPFYAYAQLAKVPGAIVRTLEHVEIDVAGAWAFVIETASRRGRVIPPRQPTPITEYWSASGHTKVVHAQQWYQREGAQLEQVLREGSVSIPGNTLVAAASDPVHAPEWDAIPLELFEDNERYTLPVTAAG